MNRDILRTAVPGTAVKLKPDWFVLTDGSVPELPATVADPSRIKVFIDHETPCGTEKHAAVQKALIQFARTSGIELFNGYGTSYSILLNKIIKEGDVIALCGDFGSIFGVKGAVSVKLSPEEMTEALRTGEIITTAPAVQTVAVTGTLHSPACAKDAALTLLPSLKAGSAVALCGDGLSALSLAEQTSFFQLLGAAGVAYACTTANEAADFTLDLSSVVPMLAGPADACAAVPVSSLAGKKVTAVFVGGCSAGRIEDIRQVAEMVKGKRINRYVRTMVAFDCTETYIQAANEGLITTIMAAGILVMNQGCSACYARSQGMVDAEDTVLSAGSRICPNCYGDGNAPTYICSAATAIQGALNGAITPVEA